MKEVSIKDIARIAGVVPSTVSAVLTGKAKRMRISDGVAEKIKRIADEEGYRPNRIAVSLRTGSSKIIGLIIEDISNAFFSSIARHIEDELEKLNYRVVYCSTENNTHRGNELIHMLYQHQVDGYLISPTAGMEENVDRLLQQKLPTVLIDRYFPRLDSPFVMSNNLKGTEKAICHLLDNGYRNIGIITSDFPVMHPQQRETGYINTLKENNIEVKEEYIFKVPYNSLGEVATELIKQFFIKTPELDAVFFTTNYLGINGLAAIKQLGLKIPDDIAVICFDDHALFQLYTPSITVIEQDTKSIAAKAVHLLMQQIAGTEEMVNMNLLDTNLIVRESV